VVLAAGLAAGRSSAEPASPTRAEIAAQLPDALSPTRIRGHLAVLQRIADRNGGNRAAGRAGYAASVRYVRDELRRAGYAPQISPFPFVEYTEHLERARQLTPRLRRFRVEAIDYSPSTPRGGVRGRLVPTADACQPGALGQVRRRIVLAPRGECFLATKAQNAANAGALALVVFNPEPGPIDATLGDPRASTIPVVAIERSVAQSFLTGGSVVIRLEVTTRRRPTTSQNVLADTHPSARRVLLVGAHLDSVVAGPGVNDNGTGVATLLEIARVLRSEAPRLTVRFAFWGAEELGLIGSSTYARTARLDELVGYLNFDMLGTRGSLRAVYAGPYAEMWLRYFQQEGLRAQAIDLSGRSDHFPFQQRGIPTGGLFAGTDICYHAACDRLAGVNTRLLNELAAAAAFGVAELAPRP
jgi:Iap family predicted aminopeptidase